MVSVRQIDRFLEQWQGSAPAAYSGAGTQGAGAMARHLAAGQRLDSFGCGASLGRDPHTVGRWAAAFGVCHFDDGEAPQTIRVLR